VEAHAARNQSMGARNKQQLGMVGL